MKTHYLNLVPAVIFSCLLIVYSCKKDDDEIKGVPIVSTSALTDISTNTVSSGGSVTSDGGSAIIERGLCWSTHPTPGIANDKIALGSGTGSFTATISGLHSNKTYYLRAFATNSTGTGYGSILSFTTQIDSSLLIVDIEGNYYLTVEIGTQTWMAENLRTSSYNDGTSIPNVTNDSVWAAISTPAYSWYNNDEITNKQNYGALYNWHAVNTGNLCPTGWHVPSLSEYTTLIDYLGGHLLAGGRMKATGTTHWETPNTGATNESGFNALPGGDRYSDGGFFYIGFNANWWTASEIDSNTAVNMFIAHNKIHISTNNYNKVKGFSLRCVKD